MLKYLFQGISDFSYYLTPHRRVLAAQAAILDPRLEGMPKNLENVTQQGMRR